MMIHQELKLHRVSYFTFCVPKAKAMSIGTDDNMGIAT